MSLVLSFESARHLVEQHAANLNPGITETSELLDANARVLAEDIFADRDLPPFPRATRDGYAIQTADLSDLPATVEVIGEIKAGDPADSKMPPLATGQAIAIMTGAPLPAGADAVVMIEHTATAPKENQIEIYRRLTAGENFVPRGAEAQAGQLLLAHGFRLDPAAIAIAATAGKSQLQVFPKPRVAVLATGDELVEITATPGPSQIRNSNSYSLAAQVQAAGADPILLPIAPDEPHRLRALIKEGFQSDLLLLTGGVSMGKYDLVEQVLTELKAEFYFTGAEIQPGRPVVFGSCDILCGAGAPARSLAAETLNAEKKYGKKISANTKTSVHKKYFLGLPGNPVSTMVTFELFARPLIEAIAGMKARPLIFPKAKLKSEIRTKTGLTRFLPAQLTGEFDHTEVELSRWQGSGDIAALARSNCYVVIPADRDQIAAGEWVSVLMP